MDYIGQLCRAGKLEATQVGRVWFVTEESLMGYKIHSEELAEKRHQEQSAFSKSIYSTEEPLLPKLTKPVHKKTPHQLSFSDSLSRAFLSLMFVGSAAVGIFTLGDAGFPAEALAEFGNTFTGVYRDIASVPKVVAKNISGGLDAFAEITEKKPLVAKVVYGVKDSLFKGNEPLLAFGFFGEAADVAEDSLSLGYEKIVPEGLLAEVPGAGFVKKLFAFISGSNKDVTPVETPTLIAQITNTSDLLSGANVPVLTVATSTGKVANINETMSLTGVAPRIIERVINNTVTNNTVERVLVGEVTRAELETRLSDVYAKIQNQLSSLGTGSGGSITNVYQTIAQSQKIDNLSNVAISNPVVTGGTFNNISISGASVSAAPLVTTTELSVTGSATSSFAGGINLTSGCFAVNGVCLTSGGGGGGGSGTVNSGTVGQIAYFDADGTTVSGTSTVFILPNGNVGIGTTTFTGSHAGKLVIDQTHDAQTVLRVANYSDTANAYSEVSVRAGNVTSYLGSTPQNSSVVTGAGSAGRGYVWSQSTGANRGLDLVAASANSDLRLFTGGTAASNERVTITSTGNVGIGSTSPYARLSVSSVSTATTTFAVRPISGQTANIMDVYSTAGVLTSVINVSGRFGIGTTTPASSLTVAGGLSVGAGIGVAAPANGIVTQGNIGIGTANPSAEFPNSWGSGVGMGVVSTSNTATIGVRSNSSTGYTFFDQTNDAGKSLLFGTYGSSYTDGGANTWFGVPKPGNSFMFTYWDSNLAIGTFGNRSLTLGTNNQARLTVLGGGNVGIGTTSPLARLNVYSGPSGVGTANTAGDDLVVENNTDGGISILTPNANNGFLMFGSPSDNFGAGAYWNANADLLTILTANTGADISFQTGDQVEAMRIFDSGNIAIGTSTPASGSAVRLTSASSQGGGIQLADTDGGGAVLTGLGGDGVLYTYAGLVGSEAYSERLRVLGTSGFVGIGTSTPGANLDVNGTTRLGGPNSGIYPALVLNNKNADASGVGVGLQFKNRNDASNYMGGIQTIYRGGVTSALTMMDFFSGGDSATPKMTLSGAGNLGIGTTTPGTSLGVVGLSNFVGAMTVGGSDNVPQLVVRATSGQSSNVVEFRGSDNVARLSIFDLNSSPRVMFNYGVSSGGDFTGQMNGVDQMSFGFNNLGSFGGVSGNASGRLLYFFDRVAGAYRGAVGPAGDLFWGTNSTTGYSVRLGTPSSLAVPLTIQGASGQSANYWEVKSNGASGGNVAVLSGSGNLGIGTTTPYARLSVVGPIVGQTVNATSTTATSTIAGHLIVGANPDESSLTKANQRGLTLYGDLNLWGGPRTIRGSGDDSFSGDISIEGGYTTFNSTGGSINLRGGAGGFGGATGNITIAGGNSSGSGGFYPAGGSVSIAGGQKSGATPGNVILQATGGNVGIGTNSPATKLTVTGIVTAASFVATSTTATSTLSGGLSVGSTNSLGRLHVSAQAPNNPVAYFVNTNTGSSDEVLHLGVGAASAGTSNLFVSFYQGSTDTSRGTRIGYIQGTGSDSVTYNTTSDVRLKENIHDTELGLEDLLKIGVKDYNFVTSPSRKVQGFIAQDLNKIYPYAVATTDDGVSPLGVNAIPWGVDYGRITPLIVKSIQDQYALYKKLEGRVADIEARITSNSNTGGFSMDSVISVLQSAGLSVVNGVTSLRELVAETSTVGSELKPTGITLYDKQTGQPYCLEISNGAMVQTPGKCVVTVRNPAPVIPPISPAVDQEEPPVVSTTTENGTDGSILENLPVSSTTPLVPEPVQDIASSTVVSENEIHEN